MEKRYVVVYYKNYKEPVIVHRSKTISRVSYPENVCIRNLAPRQIEWDYAVIEERHYRID